MIFNSAVFLYFLVVVLAVYHLLGRGAHGHRLQNLFLLGASYFFYGWWDWLYLSLIWLTTLIDFFMANYIGRTEDPRKRKVFLGISLGANLSVLFFFKYFNFFIGSATAALSSLHQATGLELFHLEQNQILLHVILPIGISFYTFQSMAYTIDVYRKVIKPERDILDFAAFVCFFPQLVAGPIERAPDLLPQLKRPRITGLAEVRAGLWHILFGYFLKVYVADHLSSYVDTVFLPNAGIYHARPDLAAGHGGAHIAVATIAFTFQVYCDFAGYSNIAKGAAFLMGFRLVENFRAPEMARNPSDLYNRWHMSLNRWFIDYVYIPMGGSRFGPVRQYRNIFLIFLVSGLWHGANWTFIVWGAINGIVLVGYLVGSRHVLPALQQRGLSLPLPRLPGRAVVPIQAALTFLSFCFAALFFRSYDIHHAVILLGDLFTSWMKETQDGSPLSYAFGVLKLMAPVLLIDLFRAKDDEHWILKKPVGVQVAVYLLLFYSIILYGVFGKNVIYFAF